MLAHGRSRFFIDEHVQRILNGSNSKREPSAQKIPKYLEANLQPSKKNPKAGERRRVCCVVVATTNCEWNKKCCKDNMVRMKTICNEKHSQALNGQTCQAKTHERKHVRHVQAEKWTPYACCYVNFAGTTCYANRMGSTTNKTKKGRRTATIWNPATCSCVFASHV